MNREKEPREFTSPPLSAARVACGINSFIEALNLSARKLTSYHPVLIAEKLKELSEGEFENYIEVHDQSVLLQNMINEKCTNSRIMEDVYRCTNEKYIHLFLTGELI